jgi:septal ring factor EnvC (AmiA/AmiB activator)
LRLFRFGLILASAAWLLLPLSGAAGQDAAQTARELESLRAQIKTLQKNLEASQAKKSRAERRLLDIERQINQVSRSLRHTDTELRANRDQLDTLHARQERLENELVSQRQGLASEARAAYVMGRQQQVKLLLNQERPAAIGRVLTYFAYLSRARLAQIDAMRSNLEQLRDLQQSIGDKTRQLNDLRVRHEEETARLQQQKRSREQLLTEVTGELASQGDELKRLRNDEQQLQELVASLQEVLADVPAAVGEQRPFKTMKGKLSWPARGELARRFGSQRGNTGLKWQGVLISAPEGGEVHAISQGRVAFSDWMRGFGLLLIIDHGDGYMSLYGQNQSLYKEVGEWVDTGEVVATLGASGGQTKPGLYFELRHKGRPINPLGWCAGTPAPAAG